jgi:hypothetical protein
MPFKKAHLPDQLADTIPLCLRASERAYGILNLARQPGVIASRVCPPPAEPKAPRLRPREGQTTGEMEDTRSG